MNKTAYVLLLTLLFLSCGKGPETLIVDSDELTPDNAEYVESSDIDSADNGFQTITIGETGTIYTMDPLFASNNSELRALDLVYETLVSRGSNGRILPELARRWEVTRDSLRYTFTIRNNVQFHNTDAFVSGIGRKLIANDVRRVFERMASPLVPDNASLMFNNIRGFQSYHAEMDQVKVLEKRVINQIEGIRVVTDSTIQITLNSPDSKFLEKLSHPMASIYPLESTTSERGLIRKMATGTGRFYLVRADDNEYIFGANLDYYKDRPVVSRLDIIHGLNEKALFDRFRRGDLDVIMEVSPSIMKTISDSSATLKPEYQNGYNLVDSGLRTQYQVFFNPRTGLQSEVYDFMTNIGQESIDMNDTYLGSIKLSIPDSVSTVTESSQLIVAQTENPFEIYMVNVLASLATDQSYTFSMKSSFTVMDNTTFSTSPFYSAQPVFTWDSPIFILSSQKIKGLRLLNDPWTLRSGSVLAEESQ